MPINFRKILLPVDFSINTKVAVKKTLELIEPQGSIIYFYHVIGHSPWESFKKNPLFFLKSSNLRNQSKQARHKLFQWKYVIQQTFPYTKIKIEIEIAGNIQKAIISKANAFLPDLIIIGKRQNHSRLSFRKTISSARIAAKSNSPVLSIEPENYYDTVKSIVMPIGNFVPRRKIEMIVALSKKFRIRIHLIMVKKMNDPLTSNALFETYRLLKQGLQCPLEYHVLRNTNTAIAALHYAVQINADILLVNAKIETKLVSFRGTQIGDVASADSHLQILSLRP
jgi:nucleotide-binding universal stress UspA family protein